MLPCDYLCIGGDYSYLCAIQKAVPADTCKSEEQLKGKYLHTCLQELEILADESFFAVEVSLQMRACHIMIQAQKECTYCTLGTQQSVFFYEMEFLKKTNFLWVTIQQYTIDHHGNGACII